jgi:hypothetical protein
MFEAMTHATMRRTVTIAEGWALVATPALLLLVGALHFHHLTTFFRVRTHYEPAAPADVVARLIAAGDRMPLLHEPHMIAYFGLPLIPLAALGLFELSCRARPLASVLSLAVTLIGTVYLGGLFGMWTAFFHGFPGVDAKYTEGATAAFAALTAPHGAFLITTTLAKLAMLGLLLQMATLVGTGVVPGWAPLVAAAGFAVIVAFWDLDNLMMMGEAMVLAGAWPMRARLVALARGRSA